MASILLGLLTLIAFFFSQSCTAGIIDIQVGVASLQLEFDETGNLQTQALQILALVKERVGEYPTGIGCHVGDFECLRRALIVELHRTLPRPEYDRQSLFKSKFAIAWCSGEGHGPVDVSHAVALQNIIGWTHSYEVYDEISRRDNNLGESLRVQCQNDFQIMIDYWFESSSLPYAAIWVQVLDFLTALGLNHVGNSNDGATADSEVGRSLIKLFSPETSARLENCTGRVCTVPAVCFDQVRWVLPCQRSELEEWGRSNAELETGDQHVVPSRYLFSSETSALFHHRLQFSEHTKFVSAFSTVSGEVGCVFLGLVVNHIAHVAELIFHAFAEGYKRAQAWEINGAKPRDPGLPFAVLALPGVGGFNCPWCEDVALAIERGSPGVLRVLFEDAFRGTDPICFNKATLFYRHMNCSGGKTKRGCSWFGNRQAARAFSESVLRGLDDQRDGPSQANLVPSIASKPLVVVVDRLGSRRLKNASEFRDQLAKEVEDLAVVEPVTYFESPSVNIDYDFLRHDNFFDAVSNSSILESLPTVVVPSFRDVNVAARDICGRLIFAFRNSSLFVDSSGHCQISLLVSIEAEIFTLRAKKEAEVRLAPSLATQADLFSRASVVVAAHGASLVNVAFMPKGSTLIEIMPYGIVDGTAPSILNGKDPASVLTGVPGYFGALAREVGVIRVLLSDPSPNQDGCGPPLCALGVPALGYNISQVISAVRESLT
jgi:hypothetical protein